VDGQEAPVFRANALVRAVPLGGGHQRVEFVYAPVSFRVGAWISLAALLVVSGLFFLPRRSWGSGRHTAAQGSSRWAARPGT
jgi:hypothetical protein